MVIPQTQRRKEAKLSQIDDVIMLSLEWNTQEEQAVSVIHVTHETDIVRHGMTVL